MNVDRNQNYQSHQVRHIDHSDENGFAVERVDTVGGIPLRLELAARFMAGDLAAPDCSFKNVVKFCEWHLDLADNLIAAHNATCWENHDEQ